MQRPLILVTNDDGIDANGLLRLIDIAKPFGNILVVAPDGARSGQSSAVTVTKPLMYNRIKEENGLLMISCSGTPVDCVKLAFSMQLPGVEQEPDIVLSGINHGANSSINVIYSGTMGAAIEGALQNKPSIGFSLCDHDHNADFSKSLPFFTHIIKHIIETPPSASLCLNVNAPMGEIKGIKTTRQALGKWDNEFMASKTPFQKDCYWLTGYFNNEEKHIEGTDHWALENGFISIQPIKTDMTDYDLLNRLNF